jgi:8-amino-7-oxononanoate synthase
MTDLDKVAAAELRALAEHNLKRTILPTAPLSGVMVERAGKRLLNFSSNDYLGLSQDEAVKEAAIAAAARYGAGAGASRLVTGDHPLYEELEAAIAALKGTEDAVVFGSGYLANLGTLSALMGRGDLIIADKLAHASLLDGARLSGADMLRFPHNDLDRLESLLSKERPKARRCLVVTEGVFSMDGDLAPLPEILSLARRHDAWTMTDDAHALGVIGGGRGSGFAFAEPLSPDIQMGTLSKAVGSYGGYVAGSKMLCDLLRNRGRSLVYSTGLPPAVVGAAIAGLAVIATDRTRVARPAALARRLAEALDLPEPQSAILPVVIGDAQATVAAAGRLAGRGFLAIAIRPPTVPQGTARLRVTLTSLHEDDHVDALGRALKEEIKSLW